MATANDLNISTWTVQGSSPIRDGEFASGERTSFPPSYLPAATSRIMYVSDSGNDGTGAYTDLATVVTPFEPQAAVNEYATIEAALTQARDGQGDWVLLKRGDSWTITASLSGALLNGLSSTNTFLLGCYGSSGARPLVQIDDLPVVNFNGNNYNYWTCYGVEFYAYTRDPNNVSYDNGASGPDCLRLVGGGDYLTVDDCKIGFFSESINVDAFDIYNASNVTIKNNILHNSWQLYDGASYCSGVFCEGVVGLTVEDNVFYNNGWNADVPEVQAHRYTRNHNIYIQHTCDGTDLSVQRNISLDASSHGLYVRPGGQVIDNFVARCPVGIEIGYDGFPLASGVNALGEDNVVIEGVDMDLLDANPQTSGSIWGINIPIDAENNGGTVTLTTNVVANRIDSDVDRGINDPSDIATKTGNVVYEWWASQDQTDVSWPHPDSVITDYMTSIGATATYTYFVSELLTREVGEIKPLYQAPRINSYFRAGFNL